MTEKQTKFKETKIGMIPEDLKRSDDFIKAVSEFLLKEKFLLNEDLNERTMTHKLAEYLQKYFQDYNVDCEYNRMMKDKDYTTKTLLLSIDIITSDDSKQTTVMPDIIIHRRGNDRSNLLVIEVKKKINSANKQFDFEKLRAFTSELKYEYGVYLEFDTEKVCEIKFFKEGNEV